MALKLKKSKIIDTSNLNLNPDSIFKEFESCLDKSRNDKKRSIKEGEISLLHIDETTRKSIVSQFLSSGNGKVDKQVNFIPDSLKNKSLISYIDAPWGSGKTKFIEEYITWSLDNSELFNKIDVIDAWEVYNGQNINDILWKIFRIDPEDKDLSKAIKGVVNKNTSNSTARMKFLGKVALNATMPVVGITIKGFKKTIEHINSEVNPNKQKFLSLIKKDCDENQKTEILSLAIQEVIELKSKNWDRLIVLDNIERLSSANRLDVINKILNWASLKGITFIFLTNFERIKLTKVFEEDFWNKISLQETFKLSNNWNSYLRNYEYEINGNKFILKDHEKLLALIEDLIPTFFSENNDSMDIREIKKLLDNWKDKNSNQSEVKLIESFLQHLVNENMSGLDKYFIINRSISLLTDEEKYWELWENDFKEKLGSLIPGEISNKPLIDNKMLRIQSNFFNLKFKIKDSKIVFDDIKLDLRPDEEKEFKEFNNFIDDHSSKTLKQIIYKALQTRSLDIKTELNKNYSNSPKKEKEFEYNYLFILSEEFRMNNYFEFKYNKLEKLYLYNIIYSDGGN